MNKSKAARVAGFIGALGASAALVGAAVNTTGAYFTDSKDGSISTSLGHVKVAVGETNLNFTDLLPGEYKTKGFDYQAQGTGAEDIWLVLPTDGSAETLLGQGDGGLGRYGHFALSSSGGANFVSNNLRTGAANASCSKDSNGWGGSNQQATSTSNQDNGSYVPFCAPSTAILLQSNMTNGQNGHVDIEFGYNKILRSGQDTTAAPLAKFKIVATQHGVRPDDINNPTAAPAAG